jgi:hypothetical protein
MTWTDVRYLERRGAIQIQEEENRKILDMFCSDPSGTGICQKCGLSLDRFPCPMYDISTIMEM